MSYKVAVRGATGEDEVQITVDTKNFRVAEHFEGGIEVELEYNKHKLAQHDRPGYRALMSAWPTEDELVLYRRADEDTDDETWEEVFVGKFTKVDTDDHELIVAAYMAIVPDALTVEVQEDTDDPARMTVLVRADNDGQGAVTLDLGEGGVTAPNLGDGVAATQYVYTAPGTYKVTATSDSDPARVAEQVVTVPYTA